MKPAPKVRLDQLLALSGLTPSREKAAAAIIAGLVLVENRKITKPGAQVHPDSEIRLLGREHPYVGRGGLKLRQALSFFEINPQGAVALDVGASTGGFTDCLLRNGAKKVYALDVGRNQLDWSLRKNPAVVELSGENFRHFPKENIPEELNLIVVDVSFISLSLIFPNLINFCERQTDVIALFKPQFESGRENVEKGGVVTDEAVKEKALRNLSLEAEKLGLRLENRIESETAGKKKKNREILTHWKKMAD